MIIYYLEGEVISRVLVDQQGLLLSVMGGGLLLYI